MKKVLCIIAALTMVAGTQAADGDDVGNLGVGYQGVFFGDLINGAAVRWAPAPFGGQIELGQGGATLDPSGGTETTADIIMLKGKFYYSLIERDNSTFYVGASLGYYMIETDTGGGGGDTEVDGFSIAPLVGTEWHFQGLPELGINFEISYELNDWESKNPDADIGLYGIMVSTGILYYF